MGRPTIASIENGRQAVALHQVMKLCEALDVELTYLVFDRPYISRLDHLAIDLDAHDLDIVQQLHGELS